MIAGWSGGSSRGQRGETALSLRRLACGSHPSHGSYTGYIIFVGWIEEWGTHWFEEKTSGNFNHQENKLMFSYRFPPKPTSSERLWRKRLPAGAKHALVAARLLKILLEEGEGAISQIASWLWSINWRRDSRFWFDFLGTQLWRMDGRQQKMEEDLVIDFYVY